MFVSNLYQGYFSSVNTSVLVAGIENSWCKSLPRVFQSEMLNRSYRKLVRRKLGLHYRRTISSVFMLFKLSTDKVVGNFHWPSAWLDFWNYETVNVSFILRQFYPSKTKLYYIDECIGRSRRLLLLMTWVVGI